MSWLLFLLFGSAAHAFPEFVRHGYGNCVTCHASPTGGGLLNEYGRVLAKELLSNGKFFFEKRMALPPVDDGEEKFLRDSVSLSKGLSLGGDVRALQVVKDNKKEVAGQFILMQADLEAGYHDGNRFTLVGTVGRAEPRQKAKAAVDYLVSRRHWLSIKMGPADALERFQLRLGRFYQAYGINIPEHTYVTRRQLGFDELQETYNAELSFLDEEWSGFLTYVAGRPDDEAKSHEEGASLQVARAVGGTHKIGWNGFFGKNTSKAGRPERSRTGFFGLLGFSPSLYSLVDASLTYDRQVRNGLAEFVKVGWEFERGVHLFFTQEYGRPTFRQLARKEAYGIGLQYFPRVHWEFLLTGRKERNTGVSREFDSVLWALAHYYF